MNRGRRLTAVLVIPSLILLLFILTDWIPQLRGPDPGSDIWFWPYALRPFEQWWAVGLAGGFFILSAYWWLHLPNSPHWGQTFLAIVAVALASLAIQIGILYAVNGHPLETLINRTLAVQTNGYFWTAANIEQIGPTLRHYPDMMTTFESDHLRTHPPGLLIANWLGLQLFESQPFIAEKAAPIVQQTRCTDIWLLDNPPHVAAALGLWSLLPLIGAATAVLPAYLLAQHLSQTDLPARFGALLVAILPGLLLFAPTPDQLSAVLILWLVGLVYWATQRQQPGLFFLAGLLLSGLTFISIGNGAISLIILFLIVVLSRPGYRVKNIAILSIGAAAIWLLFWGVTAVPPWEIIFTGLREHEMLVAAQREYWTWVIFNWIDVLIFAGFPVLLGAAGVLALPNNGAAKRGKQLAAATAVLLLILNFSGTARGEVGRIWLFTFPLLALCAGLFYAHRAATQQLMIILLMQLLLAGAVGLAWQPIEALIVVAERPKGESIPLENKIEANFENGISLDGYRLDLSQIEGGKVGLTLFWQTETRVARPYTVFNHLVNDEGELVTQADGWSLNGRWPTSCWEPREQIVDQFTLELPHDLTPGTYTLWSGLYDAKDNTRLKLQDGQDAQFIASFTIEK